MLKKRLVTGFLAALVVAGAAQAADRFQFDAAHTSVGFSVRHMVISNVRGKFNDFSGTINYDPQDVAKSSVSVTIKVASIDTDQEKRDAHLRSADFFDAAKFPEIAFQSSRVEKRGDGYVAVGTLTLHGVSKEVTIPFTVTGPIKDPWGNTRIGVEGSLTIDRRDWGLTYNEMLDTGGLIVGNEVKIELSVEAVKG